MKSQITLGLLALYGTLFSLSAGIAGSASRSGHFANQRQIVLGDTVSAPSAKVKNGTVFGRTDGLVDDFVGVPYAQPPVGQLRLRPPRSYNISFETLHLPDVATACPQQPLPLINLTGLPPESSGVIAELDQNYTLPQGEDCLTLTVQRPARTNQDAKLPVLLWIYGGGFQEGSTAMYNGSRIVQQSVVAGKPIVFVAINYRLSAFGFLASRELQREGSTNLGLKDQRLAIEYVAENIEAFGGDPSRITIWGESAGGASVFDQMLIRGGNNEYRGRPLFQGAIMDSGSIMPALPVDSPNAERIYGYVVQAAGCTQALNTADCLRSVSYETFFNASNSAPGFVSIAGPRISYLPRPDPLDDFFSMPLERAIKHGRFARVPVVNGDQEDEGTLFSLQQRYLRTTQDLIDYFTPRWPLASTDDIVRLVDTYPDNPAAGSPFGTGDANVLYPQFKRVAAIEGDVLLTLRRRQALVSMAPYIPSWSYLATYLHGFPFLGTYHTSDIGEIYDGAPNVTLGNEILAYYLNFVYNGTPNGAGLKNWPQWELQDRVLLNISMNELTYLQDDFREKSYDVLTENTSLFAY